MKKLNCWEFKKCGMEWSGEIPPAPDVCPASVNSLLNGVHDGTNAGRACWVVSGTMCEGRLQGAFAQKYRDCGACDFYKKVLEEEGAGFKMTINLLELIQQ